MKKMLNKLHASKAVVDGITFDSKAEASFYQYLKKLQDYGEIKTIVLQPEYELQAGFEKFGKKYHSLKYIPDFLVTYADGRQEYFDVKGFSTDSSRIKRTLFANLCNIPLTWIAEAPQKYSDSGWIDYDELKKLKSKAKRERKKKKGA